MPRPKSILWVDDEIDALAPHRRFLETQGFTVASAAHGDDALAMLRRQPYSVVLLDEQMPGRRGLELLPEIRAIDPAMAVVMVTQSEDDSLLRDAIGTEIDDYLVKPVHPRQVLSVVTRLLEGDRIRQQRLARDFVTRFRELEGRRGGALAWREWSELVAELARWEVRLAAGAERRGESQRPRGRAADRTAARAGGRRGPGALREVVHRRGRARSLAAPARAPRAARRDGARVQLHRSADARPLGERDPL